MRNRHLFGLAALNWVLFVCLTSITYTNAFLQCTAHANRQSVSTYMYVHMYCILYVHTVCMSLSLQCVLLYSVTDALYLSEWAERYRPNSSNSVRHRFMLIIHQMQPNSWRVYNHCHHFFNFFLAECVQYVYYAACRPRRYASARSFRDEIFAVKYILKYLQYMYHM